LKAFTNKITIQSLRFERTAMKHSVKMLKAGVIDDVKATDLLNLPPALASLLHE
jgi:hypothetical protein